MDSVNVLVVSSIGKEALQQIANVSPRIKVWDVSGLWDAPDIITAERKGDFSNEKFDSLLAQAEVIYGFRPPKNVISRAPRLKWFQCLFAGVDTVLDDEIRNSRLTVTNMRGLHAAPVAEFTLGMIFALAKKAEVCFRLKQQKKWQRYMPMLLRSKTVGIVGFGTIGREIARLSKALGMRVIATSRTAKKGTRHRYTDLVLPRKQLSELLGQSDFVVLALPLTAETDKLLGEQQLKAMKQTAYLINVGRGTTVDEEALIHAIEEQWIAGAALDAFATEPLPSSSKLWELPNVIITPHIGAMREGAKAEVTTFFCENLKRYLSGKRLLNIVNKRAGY